MHRTQCSALPYFLKVIAYMKERDVKENVLIL